MNRATLKRRLTDMEVRANTLCQQSESKRAGVSTRAFKEYYDWSVANPGKEYHNKPLQRLVDGFLGKFEADF